jgi:hypothetical protein
MSVAARRCCRFPVDPTYASGVTEASAKLMDNDAGSDGPAQSND